VKTSFCLMPRLVMLISCLAPAFGQSASYQQGSSGSAPRVLQSKLQEVPSVLDFGADPAGAKESDAALQALISAVASSGYCGHLNGGKYKLASAGGTKTIPGNVCLYGDGKYITQFYESSTGAVVSLTVNGTRNNLAHFGLIPPVGSSGATAILETPAGKSSNACGFNNYDDIFAAPYPPFAAVYKYGLHIQDSATSDCNGDVVTRSEFQQIASQSGAGVYLDATAGAPRGSSVNAFSLTDDRFAGGNGVGILCDGCGEGSVTNPFFEGLTVGMQFKSTTNTAALSTVRGVRGESTQYWFAFDSAATNNTVEIPYPEYLNKPNYTDASGGKNTIIVWGGTHSEDMGPDAISPRMCIGTCIEGGGVANQQAGTQVEIRPAWTRGAAPAIKYPTVLCMTGAEANSGCGLMALAPDAAGSGWLFGVLKTFASNHQESKIVHSHFSSVLKRLIRLKGVEECRQPRLPARMRLKRKTCAHRRIDPIDCEDLITAGPFEASQQFAGLATYRMYSTQAFFYLEPGRVPCIARNHSGCSDKRNVFENAQTAGPAG